MKIWERIRNCLKDRRKLALNIGLLLAIGIFVFSAVNLIDIFSGYQAGVEIYNEVQKIFVSEVTRETGNTTEAAAAKVTEATATESGNTEIPEGTSESSSPESETADVREDYSAYEKEGALTFMHTTVDYLLIPEYEFNFEALQALNPEVCGWVVIADTNINYPFAQGEDNQKYLRKTVLGEDNNAGCVYLDYRNENPFQDRNTILYGHNQKNGRMLHELVNYRNQSYYEEHPYVKIYLPDGSMLLYQVFASYESKTVEPYQLYFDDEEYVNFLNDCAQRSDCYYAGGKVFTEEDRIITFCTCTDEANEYRRIVQAYLIK